MARQTRRTRRSRRVSRKGGKKVRRSRKRTRRVSRKTRRTKRCSNRCGRKKRKSRRRNTKKGGRARTIIDVDCSAGLVDRLLAHGGFKDAFTVNPDKDSVLHVAIRQEVVEIRNELKRLGNNSPDEDLLNKQLKAYLDFLENSDKYVIIIERVAATSVIKGGAFFNNRRREGPPIDWENIAEYKGVGNVGPPVDKSGIAAAKIEFGDKHARETLEKIKYPQELLPDIIAIGKCTRGTRVPKIDGTSPLIYRIETKYDGDLAIKNVDRTIVTPFKIDKFDVLSNFLLKFRDMLQGVKHLHDNEYGHFDIKPENILYRGKKFDKLKSGDQLGDFKLEQLILIDFDGITKCPSRSTTSAPGCGISGEAFGEGQLSTIEHADPFVIWAKERNGMGKKMNRDVIIDSAKEKGISALPRPLDLKYDIWSIASTLFIVLLSWNWIGVLGTIKDIRAEDKSPRYQLHQFWVLQHNENGGLWDGIFERLLKVEAPLSLRNGEPKDMNKMWVFIYLFIDLLNKMTEPDASKRYDIDNVIAHPLFEFEKFAEMGVDETHPVADTENNLWHEFIVEKYSSVKETTATQTGAFMSLINNLVSQIKSKEDEVDALRSAPGETGEDTGRKKEERDMRELEYKKNQEALENKQEALKNRELEYNRKEEEYQNKQEALNKMEQQRRNLQLPG